MTEDMGVAASPPGHSDEPASSLAAVAGSVPNAAQPTHYCVVCAARWVRHEDETWSVTTPCGPCCDNVPMDTAPLVAFQPNGTIDGRDHERVRGVWDNARRHEELGRYRGILCARCDAPFEQHYDNWACPRRVPATFKFPAQAIEARRAKTGEDTGLVHESAVGNADAPKESSNG